MTKKPTPEKELENALQRKNRAIKAEKNAREKIRKADQRVKYELGGLATKAGFRETDRKIVFGVLCFGSVLLRTGSNTQGFEGFFQRLGTAAWERFAIEKDKKLFKDLTYEETQLLLSDIASVAQSFPFAQFGGKAKTEFADPQPQPPVEKRQLVTTTTHAGFEEEV